MTKPVKLSEFSKLDQKLITASKAIFHELIVLKCPTQLSYKYILFGAVYKTTITNIKLTKTQIKNGFFILNIENLAQEVKN